MKQELADFWADYKDEFLYYLYATLITVVALATVIFWVTLPLMLAIFTGVGWFMLLYLIVIPGLLTAVSVLQGRGWA